MKTKDRYRNQPPPSPPYPRRGVPKLPSSVEEGLGLVGRRDFAVFASFALWRETGLVC